MTKAKPEPPIAEPDRDPNLSDEEISRRMERGIRRFLSTPPQPHGRSPKEPTRPKRRKKA
jgi:hypothetical protein